MQKLGGKIFVRSIVGQGTTFEVRVPTEPASLTDEPAVVRAIAFSGRADWRTLMQRVADRMPEEANAPEAYKQAICDSGAADIVYSDLFTGVHGNYIRSSIESAGLDPNHLGDASQMKFGSEGSGKSKAWRDIWGCGQGIAAIFERA